MDDPKFPEDYMAQSKLSRNHIFSPVDAYNELVDYIEMCYREAFPEDKDWNRYSIFEIVLELKEASDYKKMYNDLLMENLRHNEENSSNLLKSILEVTGLIDQVDPQEEEKRNEMGMIKDLLENFQAKSEKKPTPKRFKKTESKVTSKPIDDKEIY